jgi:hypothetical protein
VDTDHLAKLKNSSAVVTAIGAGSSLEVKDGTGTPDVTGVVKMTFPNGAVTDDGSGAVTIAGGGGGGGALVLLEQHTAATSASLDFTTCISSTYDEYMIEILAIVPATNAAALYLEMGTGGGPSWDTTAAHYSWQSWRFIPDGSNGFAGDASAAEIIIDGNGGVEGISSDAAYGGLSASYRLFNPNSGTVYPTIFGNSVVYSANPAIDACVTGGRYIQTTVITGLRFIMSSGNIATGTIRIYGIAKV